MIAMRLAVHVVVKSYRRRAVPHGSAFLLLSVALHVLRFRVRR